MLEWNMDRNKWNIHEWCRRLWSRTWNWLSWSLNKCCMFEWWSWFVWLLTCIWLPGIHSRKLRQQMSCFPILIFKFRWSKLWRVDCKKRRLCNYPIFFLSMIPAKFVNGRKYYSNKLFASSTGKAGLSCQSQINFHGVINCWPIH